MDSFELPDDTRLAALDLLLASPLGLDDLEALDLLYLCWPRDTKDCTDERLLRVAQNLTLSFGEPDRLPMSSSRAWRMLDANHFARDMAEQLSTITQFIKDWNTTRQDFLILEYGEIELIEYLFEALDIGTYASLLSEVMNFKVLSLRRAGLLRRVPPRVERQHASLVTSGRADLAIAELAKAKSFLDRLITPEGYAPIVDAARTSSARLERDIKVLMAAADTAAVSIEG